MVLNLYKDMLSTDSCGLEHDGEELRETATMKVNSKVSIHCLVYFTTLYQLLASVLDFAEGPVCSDDCKCRIYVQDGVASFNAPTVKAAEHQTRVRRAPG